MVIDMDQYHHLNFQTTLISRVFCAMLGSSYTNSLTLKFSLVSHGSDYDNVHIPSVTMLTISKRKKKEQMHYIAQNKSLQHSNPYKGFVNGTHGNAYYMATYDTALISVITLEITADLMQNHNVLAFRSMFLCMKMILSLLVALTWLSAKISDLLY